MGGYRREAASPPCGSAEARIGPRRPADPDVPAANARCQHVGRLLAGAHGYLVRGARGEPLGRIAALGYGLDDRWPDALILRPHGFRGLWSGATWEVPFSAVDAVVSERREVRVLIGGRSRREASPGAHPELARSSHAPGRLRLSASRASGPDRADTGPSSSRMR